VVGFIGWLGCMASMAKQPSYTGNDKDENSNDEASECNTMKKPSDITGMRWPENIDQNVDEKKRWKPRN
jgi:hypothetical protein